MNYRIGQIREPQLLIYGESDIVTPEIVISGSINEDLYVDITNIKNWDVYGPNLLDNIREVRSEIKFLVDTLGWENLDEGDKIIASKYFTINKDKRDEVLSELSQRQYVEQLFKKSRGTDTIVGDLLHDKTIDEITNYLENSDGELFNYKELNDTFDGSIDGVWHELVIPAAPNTVVMVSVRNTSSNRYGGVREVGSELDRKSLIKANSSFTLPVKVNSESKIEVYRQNNKVKFHVTAQLS